MTTVDRKALARAIGDCCKRHRGALQIAQEDVANRIDVSVEFYARIERGTSLPSILTFMALCDALGMDANNMVPRKYAFTVNS